MTFDDVDSLRSDVREWLSAVSVFGMVPFIKLCLGTILPMLGMAKQDNMRWVLATGHRQCSFNTIFL